MVDLATLQAWLSSAEAALAKLITGQQVVEIRHGQNEVMRFTPGNIGQLRAYIADLKGQIAKLTGVPAVGARGRSRIAFF